MTTISLPEKITYHDAASRSEPATLLFTRSSSTTAVDEGAKTSQLSPLRMRSASCFETPDVRMMVTSRFFSSNAFLNSRIGPQANRHEISRPCPPSQLSQTECLLRQDRSSVRRAPASRSFLS